MKSEKKTGGRKTSKGTLTMTKERVSNKGTRVGLKRGSRNLCEMKNSSGCGWSFFVHFRIKMVSDFWLRQLSGWWHLNTHERVEISVFYSRESIIAYKI